MSKSKFYHAWGVATSINGDKHYVTVVGKFDQKRKSEITEEATKVEVKPSCFSDGVLIYSKKVLKRKLTLGVSICHPNDVFNEQIGIDVAKKRIKMGQDLGSVETSDVTMLTEDAIMGEILVKLNFICENIDKYLP